MPIEAGLSKKTALEQIFSISNNCSLWVIVLAGGEGTRMRPVIERWLGTFRPKQYCTFVGTRSMLQHTLDRAASITDPDHIITVIGKDHRSFFEESVQFEVPGTVMEQPINRGTAAGIFFPLAHVLEQDPKATVLILPSDHFVYPEKLFVKYAVECMQLAQWLDDKLVLMGAPSTRPETDYGWIEPGHERAGLPLNGGIRAMEVAAFHEKPGKTNAEDYYLHKWLWNTLIFAMKGEALWNLGVRLLPEMMTRFRLLRTVLRAVRDERVPEEHLSLALSHLYSDLPGADFSRHILQKTASDAVVIPINRVHWCDWGRPERVAETLANLGSQPAFQLQNVGKAAEA
jgi:mannose-1-phosphate guanylyltransferase